MIYHIIKPGETIKLIANKYKLTENEIIRINPHFRSWENLAPGAKLRIPEMSEAVLDEIDELEPFIEDYYPKINLDEIIINKEKDYEKPKEINPVVNDKTKKNINKTSPYYYYPYYPHYNYFPYGRKR